MPHWTWLATAFPVSQPTGPVPPADQWLQVNACALLRPQGGRPQRAGELTPTARRRRDCRACDGGRGAGGGALHGQPCRCAALAGPLPAVLARGFPLLSRHAPVRPWNMLFPEPPQHACLQTLPGKADRLAEARRLQQTQHPCRTCQPSDACWEAAGHTMRMQKHTTQQIHGHSSRAAGGAGAGAHMP